MRNCLPTLGGIVGAALGLLLVKLVYTWLGWTDTQAEVWPYQLALGAFVVGAGLFLGMLAGVARMR